MKRNRILITLCLTFMAMLSVMAGKPLYSGKYHVIQAEGKQYSVQVDIYKTYIMVGQQRCPATNQLNGWKIFHAGTNGGYTSLYYLEPQTLHMKKVIQHDGVKTEYDMQRADTTAVSGEQRYQCLKCSGTGRIEVNKPWNSGMNRDELEECRECGLQYYKSAGHRHEDCPHCAGRGYVVK